MLNGTTIVVWGWITNFIPHFTRQGHSGIEVDNFRVTFYIPIIWVNSRFSDISRPTNLQAYFFLNLSLWYIQLYYTVWKQLCSVGKPWLCIHLLKTFSMFTVKNYSVYVYHLANRTIPWSGGFIQNMCAFYFLSLSTIRMYTFFVIHYVGLRIATLLFIH